jgi:hypothetical protein
MAKEFDQKKVKIGEAVYTLQLPSAMWALELTDRHMGENGVVKGAPYSKELIETIVIEPKVAIDDFTGRLSELQELTVACKAFMLGDNIKGEVKNEKPSGKDTTAKE